MKRSFSLSSLLPKIKKGRCEERIIISFFPFDGTKTRKKKVKTPLSLSLSLSLSLLFFFFPFPPFCFLTLTKNNGERAELTPWVALRSVKPS